MSEYVYQNRHGDAWHIHANSHGGGRRPLFVMRRERHGGLGAIPDGYEIRENVHGRVSIRRTREPEILPREAHLVRETIRRRHAAGYVLDIDGKIIAIFASARDRRRFAGSLDEGFAEGFESALAERLPHAFTPELRNLFRERRRAEAGKGPKYYPLLRFVLLDRDERLFRIDRVCFSGDASWLHLETMPLAAALMKYVSRLGDDSFFELL